MTRSRDVADTQDNLGGAVAPFVAGKNRLINADFGVNQRSFTSLTCSGTDQYGFDRWLGVSNTGTVTYSTQAFTAGAAPVVGYESTNFARMVTSGQSGTVAYAIISQKIEDVRTFANQTVTVSFWAKAATGTPKIAIELSQGFGSGGSAGVNTYAGQATISTSWARYSVTVAVPSVSGKTIGAGNVIAVNIWFSSGTALDSRTGSIGIQSGTFDIWGIQAEAGNVATPFTTASGSIGGELALCQRYCYVLRGNATAFSTIGSGYWNTTANAVVVFAPKVSMRTTPSLIFSSLSDITVLQVGISWNASSAAALAGETNSDFAQLQVTSSGGTQGTATNIRIANSTSAFIGLTAEL
jgi:hypothetical protein